MALSSKNATKKKKKINNNNNNKKKNAFRQPGSIFTNHSQEPIRCLFLQDLSI